MRVAIPLSGGRLSPHFGHCEEFALIDVDPETQEISRSERLAAPPHEPGRLPRWLAEQKATVILAGGMGQRAQMLFAQHGIEVCVGIGDGDPEALARQYASGELQAGENLCDH
ncbi:MAG: ATPase [Candidatus Eisenbacteria bacterium]|nr:ATPase [Candidatus Eisenbacteria bacterium]